MKKKNNKQTNIQRGDFKLTTYFPRGHMSSGQQPRGFPPYKSLLFARCFSPNNLNA